MAMPAAAAAATATAAAIFTRVANAETLTLASSASFDMRPKPFAPASPTPSSSARTCLPPTAASLTDRRFSAILGSDLFIDASDHNRLQFRQQFGRHHRVQAQRVG